MKYKIAFLLPNLDNPGGITTSVLTTAKALGKFGHEIHLFPVGKTNITCSQTIHTVNSNKKAEQIKLFKVCYMKENNIKEFDIFISNNLRTNYILHKLNLQNSLMVFHNSRIIQKKSFLKTLREKIRFKRIYQNKNIAFVSHCLEKEFFKKFSNITPKRHYTVYNPIEPIELKKLALKETELLPVKYIVCLGRMVKEKNQEMIIRALSKIQNSDIHLILLGEGAYKEKLINVSRHLNLTSKVHFLGWKSNPYPYIKKADLLVSASKNESFGMTLLEALALQTPVVSTDILCGPNEILTSELSRFLSMPDNLNDLVKKIDDALISYPILKEEAINRFKADTIAKQYLEIIQEITLDTE